MTALVPTVSLDNRGYEPKQVLLNNLHAKYQKQPALQKTALLAYREIEQLNQEMPAKDAPELDNFDISNETHTSLSELAFTTDELLSHMPKKRSHSSLPSLFSRNNIFTELD